MEMESATQMTATEVARRNQAKFGGATRAAAAWHAYSWQKPNDLGDLRPDIDKLLEQKDGVQLT